MSSYFLQNQKAKLGFYFHIPFCSHICPYCDFTKTAQFSRRDVNAFFAALERQCDYFISNFCKPDATVESATTPDEKKFITVYFGGGTPSLFPSSFYVSLLEKLKKYFYIEEATIETNPYTNMERNFREYYAIGFNRVTLGSQSLCENTLKVLGRRHTPATIFQNIEWARKAGFHNIQADLIYGLQKNIRSIGVDEEVERIYNAGASGISAYALTLEKRTLFFQSQLDDEDNAADEYALILKKCQDLGLIQRETSHFSLYESKHNNIYWEGFPYIGIGTGAHGLLPPTKKCPYGIRYKIGENIKSKTPGNDLLLYAVDEEKEKNFRILYESPRTEEEYKQEMFFTLLRTEHGIPIAWLKETFPDKSILDLILQDGKIKRALDEKKIILNHSFLALSPEEKIRGDAWSAEFIRISL